MKKIEYMNRYYIFLPIILLITNSFILGVNAKEQDRVITINADENKLVTHLSLGGFTEGCWPGDYPKSVIIFADDVDLVLEVNFDQETVTGTISGSGSDTKYSHSYEYHWDFTGTITGGITQASRAQHYYWTLQGQADIIINVNAKWTCHGGISEEDYIKEASQTLHIIANLTADSYVKSNGFSYFSISWTDYNGLEQGTRSFRVTCGTLTEHGDCELTDELPDPINLKISLEGPESIDNGSPSAIFSLNHQGRDTDMVDKVLYCFYYKNPDWTPGDPLRDEWQWFENYIKNDLTDLIVPKENITRWLSLVDQNGKTVDGVKQLDLRVDVEIEDKNRVVLIKNHPEQFILPNWTFVCSNAKTNRYQVLGLSAEYPMKHMDITLVDESGDFEYETSTDEQGYFTLPEMESGILYRLYLSFRYKINDISYFCMFYKNEMHELSLDFELLNNKIKSLSFQTDTKNRLSYPSKLPSTISLADYLTMENGGISFLYLYQHYTEAFEFYKDFLKEEITFQLPVFIVTYTGNEQGTKYRWGPGFEDEGLSMITMASMNSNYHNGRMPHVEYHEFSHYIMHNLYKKIPQSPPGPLQDVNHAGYLNPTTADSYAEGFAQFMSVVIANHYQHWWMKGADSQSYSSVCRHHGSLEVNDVVWGNRGRDEEWAVAGVLWDLIDGEDEAKKEKNNLQQEWPSRYTSIMNAYDFDNDGKLDKHEYQTCMILKRYDPTSPYPEIARADVVRFIGDILTPLSESDTEVIPSEIFSKFESNNPLLVFDKNKDNTFSHEEFFAFINASDIVKDYMMEDYIIAYFKGYDLNQDTYLSGKELTRLAAGEDFLINHLGQYDTDGDGSISKDEVYQMVQKDDNLYRICFKGHEAISGEVALLLDNNIPDIITLEYIMNTIKIEDDDNVDLTFLELWSILRSFHNDFTSIYESLIDTYPDLKKEIDAIFIAHGFFVETAKGNGEIDDDEPRRDGVFVDYPLDGFKYNFGETIGSAGNYDRQERRSFVPLPGHFVRTDDMVPLYHVEVELYDDPSLYYGFPTMCYHFSVFNEQGFIYVPVPPAEYQALINITGVDVKTGNPLFFSGEEFYDTFKDSVVQGYYVSHDFEISGDIPEYPVDPFSASSDISNNLDDNSSSGFEILILVCALFLIFVLKRKAIK